MAKAYGVESICVQSADEFLPAMKKAMAANKEGRPFLVEAPMENIVVPTPGCWNINDIYSPSALVKEGKLVKDEKGRFVAPNHAKSHKGKYVRIEGASEKGGPFFDKTCLVGPTSQS